MTNFEHLRNVTRTFEGMLEMLTECERCNGCILDQVSSMVVECPPDCTCRTCIGTWLSSEYEAKEKTV